jgi:large subunit ribosomal protein L21
MAKIAIIKTGGKQYKVAEGEVLKIEKLEKEDGEKVQFETLLIADDKEINIGTPSLGEKVEAEVVRGGRAKKVSVIKFKNKTRYRRNVGHRQPFSEVKIVSIA